MRINLGLGLLASVLFISSACTVGDEGIEEDDTAGEDIGTFGDPTLVDEDSIVVTDGPPESEVGQIYYAARGDCSHGGIEVFEHEWYEGAALLFCSGDFPDLSKYTDNLGWFANWNDRISSAMVNGKVKVYMYEKANYGGEVKIYYPGRLVHFGYTIWNDAVSSIKVRYYPY
jgi:hypothetical protein